MNRRDTKFFIVAGCLLILASCTSPEEKTGKDQSKLLHMAPVKHLTDSISRFPERPDLYLQRAVLLSQHNLQALATPDYKKAWEITGDQGIAMEYASNLLLTNAIDDAVELLQEGSKKFPDNTEFSRRLAEVYLQNNQHTLALEQYDHIIAKDSSNFEAWFDRGSLLAKMKDTSEAINSLETSFSLLPINYSGMALANLYVEKKDPKALEICDILLSKDSSGTQTEPVFMKGVYYAETREYDKALKLFDECIKRDWKMTDAYIEKGIIYFERKNYPSALKTFHLAVNVSNTDADVYFWIGRCFEANGDKKQAAENYERALALDHSFSEARTALHRVNG